MSKRTISGIVLIPLLFGMLNVNINIQPVKALPTTVVVPDDYARIQDAINHANVGDTIYVRAGIYYEHVVVNKTVALIGEGPNVTAINGNDTDRTVAVTANNVNISDFRIEHGGWDPIIEYDDCSLFINGTGTNIINNDIKMSYDLILIYSSDNTIKDNNIYAGVHGIIFSGFNNTVAHNYIKTSGCTNLALRGSNNTIVENYIANSGWCIAISSKSQWNKVSGNTIVFAPSYAHFCSIYLGGSYNTITNNTLIGNAMATVNVFGVTVTSSNNSIHHNNFFNNTQHVVIKNLVNNTWDNGYPSGGNYWSDYAGVDVKSGPYQNETGADKMGDKPYVIDENNRDNYPLIYPYPCPTTPWDITGPIEWVPDSKCDMRDVARVSSLFGSVKGDARYDERADIAGPIYLLPDNKIDIRDIALVAVHFGETYP